MTFLPIIDRELRVAARRKSTYRLRVTTGLVAFVMFCMMMQTTGAISLAQVGSSLFRTLSFFLFVYCLLAGTRVTADCISEEKREGTLGLLFLTDLKGYDVVLGKLAATSLNAVCGLMAALPVLALTLLLGGVWAVDFWSMVATLLNTLLFSLTAGLFVSSISRQDRQAASGTFLLISSVTGGLPLAGVCIAAFIQKNAQPVPSLPFLLPSPGYAFGVVTGASFGGLSNSFWWSMLTIHLLSWVFLALASFSVPRTWQEKPAGVKKTLWRDRLKRWAQGNAVQRQAYRTRLLEINPVCWLAGRDRLKSAYVWFFLAMIGVVWLWGWQKLKDDWLQFPVGIGTAVVIHTILKLWVASEACRRFAEDQKSGALELILLCGPMRVQEIVRGQWLALRRQFAGPAAVVLVVDLGFLYMGFREANLSKREQMDLTLTFLAGMSIFIADLYSLSWVSMWAGLSLRNPSKASAYAVGRVLAMPWLFFWIFMAMAGLVAREMRWRFNPQFWHGLAVWFAIGMVADIAVSLVSRRRLITQFRTIAMHRYSSEPAIGFLGRLGRTAGRWWSGLTRRRK